MDAFYEWKLGKSKLLDQSLEPELPTTQGKKDGEKIGQDFFEGEGWGRGGQE